MSDCGAGSLEVSKLRSSVMGGAPVDPSFCFSTISVLLLTSHRFPQIVPCWSVPLGPCHHRALAVSVFSHAPQGRDFVLVRQFVVQWVDERDFADHRD